MTESEVEFSKMSCVKSGNTNSIMCIEPGVYNDECRELIRGAAARRAGVAAIRRCMAHCT